jgi:hypothetical protein
LSSALWIPLLIVGVLVALGAGYWWHSRQPTQAEAPLVDPLAYVPTDAEAVVVVRVAELWKKLPPPLAGDHDPVPDLEEDTGLVPEQVERVWFVWHRPKENIGWAVIRTTQKIDRDKLVGKLRERSAHTAGDLVIHAGLIGAKGRSVALVFLDDFTALVGSLEGVGYAVAMPRKGEEAEGPFLKADLESPPHDVFALVNHKPHNVFALVPHQGEWERLLGQARPAQPPVATLDVLKGEARLEALLVCQTPDEALSLSDQVSTYLLGLGGILRLQELRGGPVGAAFGKLGRTLAGAACRQNGRAVTLELKGDAGELVRALASLPRALK